MTKQGDFLIYCVETYKNAKHLTGKQVAELFTRYRVWDYVYSCYEACTPPGPIILWRTSTSILRQGNLLCLNRRMIKDVSTAGSEWLNYFALAFFKNEPVTKP